MSQQLTGTDWLRHEENVAAVLAHVPGAVNVGVGDGLIAQTGLPGAQLADMVARQFHALSDGGANLLVVHAERGKFAAYVRRRGRHVDVGNRADFVELGWGRMCDLLDLQARQYGMST